MDVSAHTMATSAFDDVSLIELWRRRSHKWRAFPHDVLPAFVAEMDFELAPPIKATLVEAVAIGDTGYAWPIDEMNQAVSGFLHSRMAWNVDPADITLIPDVMVGVTEMLRVVANPGDGVVVNTPIYPPFFSHIREAGCQVLEAPLADGPDGYELDFHAIERAFDAGARVYLLCNPHNPTGLVFSPAELGRIAELAERHKVLVFADEIHSPLTLAGSVHTPFLSLGGPAAEWGISFISASKGWNIPGLKCAQLIATSESTRALVRRMPQNMVARVGNLGIIAGIAAYRDGGQWLDEALRVIDRNRHLLTGLLAQQLPAVRYVPPQAGYLAWLDCRGLGLVEEPVSFFLARGKVALGPGPNFGGDGAGHVRITIATSEEILRDIVARMHTALGSTPPIA